MTVPDSLLLESLETSMVSQPRIPGLSEALEIPGVQGRITAISFPFANMVGGARLRDETADATVERVRETFATRQKAFGWVVGPGSMPADLPRRLTAAGMEPLLELDGLVLDDLRIAIPQNPKVWVRPATAADARAVHELLAHATGFPDHIVDFLTRVRLHASGTTRNRTYLAYVEGNESPVAVASHAYVPERPVVWLSGAGTLTAHRGQGVYRALLARRLADARADGMEVAVIQASRDTSAPICRRLGFRAMGTLEVFVWNPPAA